VLYELREYDVIPGRMQALNDRFANLATRYFALHGIEALGFWTDTVGTSNRLTYLLRYRDMAHREQAWNSFMSDPDRLAAFAESERDGLMVSEIRNRFLAPTDYSPMD
jgi:hypothetical protein